MKRVSLMGTTSRRKTRRKLLRSMESSKMTLDLRETNTSTC